MTSAAPRLSGKDKILQAALAVIRTKGYTATTVDDLCAAAGVTKGAFFHHFDSKEALGVAAAQHWARVTTEVFASAPYHRIEDPRERLLGYLDYRIALLKGNVPEFTCLVGTMVQEAFDSSPAIRDACHASIFGHAEEVAKLVQAAKDRCAPTAPWDAKSLALHTQAVIQGAFILAKAQGSAEIAADSITHLRRYVETLLPTSSPKETV